MEEKKAVETDPTKRGLPTVLFIEDEESFLKKTGLTEEAAALEMRQAFTQLRSLKDQFLQRKDLFEEKLPENEKSLSMIRQLKKQKSDLSVQYELTNGIFAKAKIPKDSKVALWLGANVMLEYTLEEAEEFLQKSGADLEESLRVVNSDLKHIQDQMNILEVNINRMHLHSIEKRKVKMMKEMEKQQQQQQQQMAAMKAQAIAQAQGKGEDKEEKK